MNYTEEEMLMLSGIQHYLFCPRQWALIHIEQQWNENHLTTEGNILHSNVDNPYYRQKNGEHITLRSVHIASSQLGLYGIADAVELIATDNPSNSISHPRYEGSWLPIPIEYKRGHSKTNDCDRVQVAAQVIALEEMYGVQIECAVIFYWETRRRETVPITIELRDLTSRMANEMHEIYRSGKMPVGKLKSCCKSCSLQDNCMPQLSKIKSASNYLKQELYAETT
ncbi:MAG: CRISPR-associated protein Cas4 [Rikenellaceae bacterium]